MPVYLYLACFIQCRTSLFAQTFITLLFNFNFELIIHLKVCIIDTETGKESEFYTDEFKTDYEDNLESKVTCNKLLLLGLHSAK